MFSHTQPLTSLPVGVKFALFSFLDVQSLGRMSQTAKEWNQFVNSNEIWHERVPTNCRGKTASLKLDYKQFLTKTVSELLVIARKDIKHAQMILNAPQLVSLFNNIALVDELIADINIAKLIIRSTVIMNNSLILARIKERAETNPEIALALIHTTKIANQFNRETLKRFAEKSEQIAEFILTSALSDKLNEDDLFTFANQYLKFANIIFTRPDLIAKFSYNKLFQLLKTKVELASLLLNNTNLPITLKDQDLKSLILLNIEYAQQILKFPTLANRPAITSSIFRKYPQLKMTAGTNNISAASKLKI